MAMDFRRLNKLIFGKGLMGTKGTLTLVVSWHVTDYVCHKGDHHRKQRKLINPVFASNHLRDMLPMFYEIAYKVIWHNP